ncbi:MFS transporter [Brevundimonas sp. BAL450]|jgi:MFS transporter, ACS family, hexuronate transporter|uniref:Hexuronate transporter n=1 Tax=Brevundimonas abyssalis TAR-001 TaxID=1391729 RepID=A0A8E0N7T2_9CAUL|nr:MULTISPECIES: MFS transporter [Brevundimonas]MBG7616566.1 MFS transporter [Brevundimonas sp. BAL450]GAD57794.1 hexuronate transporter [Brevundimonas abyssalis TAR-001]
MSEIQVERGPRAFRGNYRWVICALLFLAITINYVDRLIFGVLKPVLEVEFGWSESDYANIVVAFQGAYAIGLLLVGRLIDRIGARWGLGIAIGVWSLAAAAHAGASSVIQFAMARFALGVGESAGFPGAVKAVSEWFPKRERALATGIFNAGSNVGALLTPILVPILVLAFGWRAAFIVTGLSGLVLMAVWFLVYRRPREHPRVTHAELAHIESDPPDAPGKISWGQALKRREAWAFIVGKFLTDPVWWLFLFWLPDFFGKTYDLNLLTFGPPLVAVYLLADVGSVGGGWLSSRLIHRGWSVNRGRKTAMLVCALCVTPISIAVFADNLIAAVAVIGLAAAAHQGWSANLFTLVSDTFPKHAVATVVGLGGFAGAIGGMFIAKVAGWTLEATGSYVPLLAFASVTYLIALGVIHLLTPQLKPAALPPA